MSETNDTQVERLLAVEPVAIDTAPALERLRTRVGTGKVAAYRGAPRRWLQGFAAVAALALVAGGLAVTGVAETLFIIFEPKQVAPVAVRTSDFAGLPDLREYGTFTVVAQPSPRAVADAAAAARESGLAVLTPATLPAGLSAPARFSVVSSATGTFAFDEAKLQAAAAAAGRTPPPMPPAIARTTLTMSGGPAVLQTYGAVSADPSAALTQTIPLLIVQAKAPLVTSNGASVEELRAYLLAQPGLSPQLAAQIRAIGDPVGTLPVIVPVDLAQGKSVTVRGTKGVLIGDATGLGSAVVWLEGGVVHLVAGALAEAQVLEVANSLR